MEQSIFEQGVARVDIVDRVTFQCGLGRGGGVNYMSVTEGRGVKKKWPLWLFFWRRFQNMAAVLNDKKYGKTKQLEQRSFLLSLQEVQLGHQRYLHASSSGS